MAGFDAVFDLSALDGSNGFRIAGVAAGDYNGRSVSAAGDINGDGRADFIIGASGSDPNGASSGAAYVVFGSDGGFPADLNLSALDGTNGFRISGEAAGDASGGSVSAAGDVNGDGIGDLIIGATGADPNGDASGAAYVVFGSDQGFAADLDLSTLDGTDGFKLSGEAAGDRTGGSVSDAGDINGDGFGDIVVGARDADPNGGSSGAAYVVFGSDQGFTADLDLTTLDGSNGFKIEGALILELVGDSVSSAGDVNGDGFDDLLVGASYASADYNGSAFVVFGSDAGFPAILSVSDIDGTNGFQIRGANAFSHFGSSVSNAGDVNGDGFDDVVVGAPWYDGTYNGVSYVVFGLVEGFPASLDASDLDGTNGFAIAGEQPKYYSGRSVSAAGDVNGDGTGDIIIGARNAAYVVFGSEDSFAARVELSGLDGTDGFRIEGPSTTRFHDYQVSVAGDVNGDGLDDLLVGVSGVDANGDNSGASYVIFGVQGDLTLRGTSRADTLVGRSADDTISGLGGDDVLRGEEGDDTLSGGNGNDRLDGGTGTDSMAGGAGNDRYLVDRSGDTVREIAGGGADLVFSSAVSFTLSDNVETLILVDAATRGIGSDDRNSLRGNGADNTLLGRGGSDVLAGREGDDRLDGGVGFDKLVGGLGDDAFVLAPAATDRDRLVDFTSGEDILEISADLFGGDLTPGRLATTRFVVNGTGEAGDANDRFIYDRGDGRLYFDADGTGDAFARQFVAVLDPGTALARTDFLIV